MTESLTKDKDHGRARVEDFIWLYACDEFFDCVKELC